jgi:hypothetical protein
MEPRYDTATHAVGPVDARATAAAPSRLRVRNPISLLASPAPWASAWYLATYLVLGGLWFALTVAVLLTSTVLSLTWIGLPLLVLAFTVIRGLAGAERLRAGIVGLRVPAPTARPVHGPMSARLRARLQDGQGWRRIVLLVVLWPWLLAVDLAALVVWLICVMLISLPFWYRYPRQQFDNGVRAHGVQLGYYPDGPHGTHRYGWFVDDLHSSLLAAGAGVVLLVLVGNYAVVAAARHHARMVVRLAG